MYRNIAAEFLTFDQVREIYLFGTMNSHYYLFFLNHSLLRYFSIAYFSIEGFKKINNVVMTSASERAPSSGGETHPTLSTAVTSCDQQATLQAAPQSWTAVK